MFGNNNSNKNNNGGSLFGNNSFFGNNTNNNNNNNNGVASHPLKAEFGNELFEFVKPAEFAIPINQLVGIKGDELDKLKHVCFYHKKLLEKCGEEEYIQSSPNAAEKTLQNPDPEKFVFKEVKGFNSLKMTQKACAARLTRHSTLLQNFIRIMHDYSKRNKDIQLKIDAAIHRQRNLRRRLMKVMAESEIYGQNGSYDGLTVEECELKQSVEKKLRDINDAGKLKSRLQELIYSARLDDHEPKNNGQDIDAEDLKALMEHFKYQLSGIQILKETIKKIKRDKTIIQNVMNRS